MSRMRGVLTVEKTYFTNYQEGSLSISYARKDFREQKTLKSAVVPTVHHWPPISQSAGHVLGSGPAVPEHREQHNSSRSCWHH